MKKGNNYWSTLMTVESGLLLCNYCFKTQTFYLSVSACSCVWISPSWVSDLSQLSRLAQIQIWWTLTPGSCPVYVMLLDLLIGSQEMELKNLLFMRTLLTVSPGGSPHLYLGEALPAGDVRRLHVPSGPLCGHYWRQQPRGPHGPFCGVLSHLFPRRPQRRHRQEALQPHHRRDIPLFMEGSQETRWPQGSLTGEPWLCLHFCCPGWLPSALRSWAGVPSSSCVRLLCWMSREADVCEHTRVDQEQVHGHVNWSVHDRRRYW